MPKCCSLLHRSHTHALAALKASLISRSTAEGVFATTRATEVIVWRSIASLRDDGVLGLGYEPVVASLLAAVVLQVAVVLLAAIAIVIDVALIEGVDLLVGEARPQRSIVEGVVMG